MSDSGNPTTVSGRLLAKWFYEDFAGLTGTPTPFPTSGVPWDTLTDAQRDTLARAGTMVLEKMLLGDMLNRRISQLARTDPSAVVLLPSQTP